ncbi:hypothetical protein EDD22DRAFT_892863 [Suillus occidentalis]|nr:hypothetical protein EDD22DRAFT_892863 [Suillus occidentalis]
MVLPFGRRTRVRLYARNFFQTIMPAAVSPEDSSTGREDESQTQSDPPELPHPTEATQTDDSSASVEKLNENPGAAFRDTAGTSVVNGDTYTCAECSIKMKGIFYACLTCAESHCPIALCGDCAFHDVFNVVTEHHPYKHWLVKIKDRVQDVTIKTSAELLENVDETTSLSFRVDKLAALVESRFVEQDLRLSALVTQIDKLVHSLGALTGKAELPSESVTV